jgi:hypothetical protein
MRGRALNIKLLLLLADAAKYGIYMPGLPKAGPPHIVPREPGA